MFIKLATTFILSLLAGLYSGKVVYVDYATPNENEVQLSAEPYVFKSRQVGSSPTNTYVLQTNGTDSTWVSPSSLGISGGGSGGGTWSTTTSQVASRLVNYPNNTTDIVAIGSNSTTTAEYFFDPNVGISYLSGNVGIGSTSPISTLTVQTTSGEIARFAGSSNSNNSYISLFDAGNQILLGTFSTGGFVGTFGSQTFNIRTSNTNRLSVTSTGNVGIGTTSPYQRLSVAGNVIADSFTATSTTVNSTFASSVGIGSTSPSGKLVVQGSGTGNVILGEWGGSSNYGAISLAGNLGTTYANFYSAQTDRTLYINRPSTASINFVEGNGTAQMRLVTGGNLGIGTTSPYAKLHVTTANAPFGGFSTSDNLIVENNGDSILNIVGGTSNNSAVYFSDNSRAVGRVSYDHSQNSLALFTASTEKLRITSTGNVGIGTSSPLGFLSTRKTLAIEDTTNEVGMRLFGTVADMELVTSSQGGNLFTRSNHPLSFGTNNTEVARITSTGNIGVGVTSPNYRFTLGSTTAGLHNLISAATGAIVITQSGNPTMMGAEYTGASSASSGSFVVLTQNDGTGMVADERMGGFQFGGYDGVSTTRLGAAITAFAEGTFSATSVPTNLRFETAPSGSATRLERLRVTSSGNVGIGTTSPYTQLSVVGNVAATTFIATSTTATSTFSGFIQAARLHLNGAATSTSVNGFNISSGCFAIGGVCIGGGSGSGTVGSGTTGQFPYYAGAGTTLTATSTVFVSTGSNVGIGTTTPNYKLVVQGGTAATSTAAFVSSASGKGGAIILEDVDGAGCTEITALDGVIYSKVVTCPAE